MNQQPKINGQPIEPGMYVTNRDSKMFAVITKTFISPRPHKMRVRLENGSYSEWVRRLCRIVDKPPGFPDFSCKGSRAEIQAKTQERREKIVEMAINTDATKAEIAEAFGVHKGTVDRALREAGVTLKRYGGTPKPKRRSSRLNDPNKRWNGRFCRKCGKKIKGGNWWYCRTCQSQKVAVAPPGYLDAIGQNLLRF